MHPTSRRAVPRNHPAPAPRPPRSTRPGASIGPIPPIGPWSSRGGRGTGRSASIRRSPVLGTGWMTSGISPRGRGMATGGEADEGGARIASGGMVAEGHGVEVRATAGAPGAADEVSRVLDAVRPEPPR